VVFKDRDTADKVLNDINAQRAVELTDACVAFRDAIGRPHLKQAFGPVPAARRAEAALGSLWITLAATLLANPLTGAAAGDGADPADRNRFDMLLDCGIGDDFVRTLREALAPNCSALFVRIGGADDEGTLRAVQRCSGLLLRTSLSDTQEQNLRTVLSRVEKR